MSLRQAQLDSIAAGLENLSDAEWDSKKAEIEKCFKKNRKETRDQLMELYDAEEAARPRE